jgi:hypothetical protein
MFPNACTAEFYHRFCTNIDTFWNLPRTCNGLVTNLLSKPFFIFVARPLFK